MTQTEKNAIYDRMCGVLTDYEEGKSNENDLYEMLVEMQNEWEALIVESEF